MSEPSVSEREGKWWVGDDGPFDTNAQAWRWLDRRANEPISKKEAVADWISRQQ